MDALSDPRAFLSAQEKRAQQMKAMGIEESDISTKDLKTGNGIGNGPGGSLSGAIGAKAAQAVRFEDQPKGTVVEQSHGKLIVSFTYAQFGTQKFDTFSKLFLLYKGVVIYWKTSSLKIIAVCFLLQ